MKENTKLYKYMVTFTYYWLARVLIKYKAQSYIVLSYVLWPKMEDGNIALLYTVAN